MKLIYNDAYKSFKNIFTEKHENKQIVASKYITPSGLKCEAAVAFKMTEVPMEPEYKSFEDDGYSESGESRHKQIQKFLSEHPDIEWVNVKQYIEENQLPFNVEYEYSVIEASKKYNIDLEEACTLLHSYERTLVHTNDLIKFKLDGLIKYQGQYYIVEIKTVGGAKLAKAPLPEHQDQGICYCMLLNIPRLIWIYEDRSYFKHVIAFQEISNEEMQNMENKLNRIVEFKDHPEMLSRCGPCTYCRYKQHCQTIFTK